MEGIDILGAKSLNQVVNYLNGQGKLIKEQVRIEEIFSKQNSYSLDFSEVKGQENIKRAIEVAAARRT